VPGRDRVMSVRFSAEEQDRVAAAAAKDGVTTSEYLRRAALFVAIPVVEQVDARCEHLSTAGRFVAVSCGACGPLPLVPVKGA
jgi:hypothetical protein